MTNPLNFAVLAQSHMMGMDYVVNTFPDAVVKRTENTAEATILNVPRRIVVVTVDSADRLRGQRLMGWAEVGYVDARLVQMAASRILG